MSQTTVEPLVAATPIAPRRVPSRVVRGAVDLGIVGTLLLVALLGPAAVLGLLVVAVAVLVFVRRPAWSVPIALVLAFTTFPGFVPVDFPVGSTVVHAFEPFLAIATVWSVATRRAPRWADIASAVLIGVLLLWAGYGVLQHNPWAKVVFDVRPMAHLIAALAVSARLGTIGIADRARRILPWILWFSAAMTLLASTIGIAITGSAEAATLYLGDAASDATRLRGPTTDLALIVLCAVMTLYVLGRCHRRHVLGLAVPAFLIVFLAFSRYTVLGVAFTVVFAMLAARSWRGLLNIALLAGTLVMIGLLVGAAAPRLAGLPGGSYVVSQVSGFQQRVLGGLTGQVIAEDGSAQYRLLEDTYLIPQIEASPFTGHGFGFAYKPPATEFGVVADVYAPYYSHNYYLWIAVKTGLLGAAIFLGTVLMPVAIALRRPTAAAAVLATALGVLMVDSFVAPMPNGDTTATLVGIVLGALIARLAPSAPAKRTTGRVLRRAVRPVLAPQ